MKVKIAEPYGFCVGVENVLKLIHKIKNEHNDMPIYCLGQIVHNEMVNEDLKKQGINILIGDKKKNIEKLKKGVVIFSAHGTDEKLIEFAKNKGLIVYNAACPFVNKEFSIIRNKIDSGYDVIYIGIKNHDETIAAMSISPNIHFVENITDLNHLKIDNNKIITINQTTLSVLDLELIHQKLREKYPHIIIFDEICNSTRLRQQFIMNNKDEVDGIIVVGDINSNNTKSLRNIACELKYDTIMVNKFESINVEWLIKKKSILIVSGASTPKKMVEDIYNKIINYIKI